jgi:signal transduction histidine kinase
MTQDAELQALNAVLRVAARHANLLAPEAWAELAAALGGLLRFDRVSLVVPEGPRSLRVHAVSRVLHDGGLVFGGHIIGDPDGLRLILEEQRPFLSDDMLAGNDAERDAARGGMRSFAAFPVRDGGRVIAVLIFGFTAAGQAGHLPQALAQEVADTLAPAIDRALTVSRERRLAMILDTSGDAMLAWDRHGLVTDANGAAAALTGRPLAELRGTPIAELLDPLPSPAELGSATGGARHALLARGAGPEARPQRVPVAATVTAVLGDPLVAAHALLRDLSHLARAEEEAQAHLARIHELEEQHRTLLDNAPLIIFRLDPGTGALVFLNRHAERLLGVPTLEAMITPDFLRDAHADAQGQAAFAAGVARARAGGISLPYEAHLRRRHGAEITARGTIYPLMGEAGRVAAIEGVLADVSAEQAARARLVQTDRLSTLGNLASGVAHEINNPAAFILLGLDMLERMLKGPGADLDATVAANVAETVKELRESIRRIVDITRDLRLLASPPAPDGTARTLVDVNRTVESAISLTRGQILACAQIERHLDEIPPVLMEDGRLGQVVVNLLVNAVQAMPRSYAGDNTITVTTQSDGHTVELEITDTGTGIAPEHLHRIWQPFFSTKGNVGTGLGLSIGREIVERAGGTITVQSPVPGQGNGTRFLIRLPAAGDEEPESGRQSPIPGSVPGAAAVLVIDDEPALGRALAEELGRAHQVTVAGSAEVAWAMLGERRFDVVLCDLRMPGMNGEELYARVLEKNPAQARGFVFMTGVAFGAEVERFLAASGRPMLEKPFPASAAIAAIERVIRGRP